MRGYQKTTLGNAKVLRTGQTIAETRLWKLLRGRQLARFKFRRQQPIGPYIADFVCLTSHLIVEVDGSHHADNEHDKRRDAWLAEAGYRVLRFWNNEILTNADGVLRDILAALDAAPSPTAPGQQAGKASYPLPQGERREIA